MPNVTLLCGKIASGKTHYAEKMYRSKGVCVLSSDELLLTLFDGCLADKHVETESRALLFLCKQAKSLYDLGNNVIIDCGFWYQKQRNEARTFFQTNHISYRFLFFDTDDKLRRARLEERNKTLAKATERVFLIEEETLFRLDRKFEGFEQTETDILIFNEDSW